MKWLDRRHRKREEKKQRRQLERQYILQPRLPTIGDHPIDYIVPLFFSLEVIQEKAAEFLNTMNLDNQNKAYFDMWLKTQAIAAVGQLDEQKATHQRVILMIQEELNAQLRDVQANITELEAVLSEIDAALEEEKK